MIIYIFQKSLVLFALIFALQSLLTQFVVVSSMGAALFWQNRAGAFDCTKQNRRLTPSRYLISASKAYGAIALAIIVFVCGGFWRNGVVSVADLVRLESDDRTPIIISMLDDVALVLLVFQIRKTVGLDQNLLVTKTLRSIGIAFAVALFSMLLIAVVRAILWRIYHGHVALDRADYALNSYRLQQRMLPWKLWMTFVVPVSEELFFREFVLSEYRRLVGPYIAIIVQGLLFGVMHFPTHHFIYVTCVGIILGACRLATRSLSVPVVVHCLQNCLIVFGTR